MKTKLFHFHLILLITLSASAQITIRRSDIGNLTGITLIYANDNSFLNTLSPGNAGANKTWNLTGISNDEQDTSKYFSPQGLLCSNLFPTANIALDDSIGTVYFTIDNNVFSCLGYCMKDEPGLPPITYLPSYKQLTFPSTYHTSFSGVSRSVLQYPYTPSPPDSIRIVETLTYTSLMDGWGNLITPKGTYSCLRQKFTIFLADSVYFYTTGYGWFLFDPSIKDTIIAYNWMSKNNPFIAQISTDPSGNVLYASYLLSSNLGIDEPEDNSFTFSVFPNPSNGKFTISFKNGYFNTIEIYNLIGERVFIKDGIKEQSSETIDLSNFPKGIYFIKINDGEKTHTEKVVIQ
jgi:hypothetical protein